MIVEDKVIIDALERAYYWTCIKSAETAIGRTKLFYRLQYSPWQISCSRRLEEAKRRNA